MRRPNGHGPAAAPTAPVVPWRRIAVGVPGPEFEAWPPGQDAFDFPDTECDGWSVPGFTVRSASVRGARHRYYRQPRQDAARAAAHEATGSIAFAVADGVSSASRSEVGAVEACRAAVARILHQLSDRQGQLDLQDVVQQAAERLLRLGDQPPDATGAGRYATTLVAGAVRPDPAGPTVELCRVGDSGAWLLDPASGRYQPLVSSKTGTDSAVVSNEVTSLPDVPDPVERVGIRPAQGQVLLVGTDGFADPLGDGDGQVGALFAHHLARPPAPPWLAHLLDFSRETFDDDRSLLVVWPHAPAGPP